MTYTNLYMLFIILDLKDLDHISYMVAILIEKENNLMQYLPVSKKLKNKVKNLCTTNNNLCLMLNTKLKYLAFNFANFVDFVPTFLITLKITLFIIVL